jgi:hypothetical protein
VLPIARVLAPATVVAPARVVLPAQVAAPASVVAPPNPPMNCAWVLGGNAHTRPASRTAVTGFATLMPFVFFVFMFFFFLVCLVSSLHPQSNVSLHRFFIFPIQT